MQERDKPENGHHPSTPNGYDTSEEQGPTPGSTESREAQNNPTASNQDTDTADNKSPQMRIHRRFWEWVREPRHSNALVAIFTIFLFITTTAYTIFAALQWWTMRDTFNEMRKSGNITTDQTWRAIDNMNWLAKTMDGSLKQSQATFEAARKSAIAERRPWVIANEHMPEPGLKRETTSGRFLAGVPLMWRVYFSNYGRSPAWLIGGTGQLFFGPRAMERANAWFGKIPVGPGSGSRVILPPGGPPPPQPLLPGGPAINIGQTYSTLLADHIPTEDDVKYIYSHEFAIVVIGRTVYKGQESGEIYWTDFCFSTFSTGAANMCPNHNEAH